MIATNRHRRYAYADQLDPPLPNTVAQALAENNARSRTLIVYESDGKTPVGEFTVGR